MLPNTDSAGARLIADKLLNSVRALKLPHSKEVAEPYVTISIGVTTGRVGHKQSWEEYVKRADEAMYISKQSGRNKYTYLDLYDDKQ